MRTTIAPRIGDREEAASRPEGRAENRLFDACCDVLEAARELELRAADPASAGAVLATAGCISAALESLAAATSGMRAAAIRSEAAGSPSSRRWTAVRLERATVGLRAAARACGPEGAGRDGCPPP